MKILNDKKGLTLIELLATIIVLCLVVGFSILIVLSIVRKVKANSYKVTINEVEADAYEYVVENSDRLLFVPDESDPMVEFQCVTVQNLIDFGYLNNNVINSAVSDQEKVQADSNVYVERNTLTKSITKKEYVTLESEQVVTDRCGKVIFGEITFDVAPSIDEWTKTKTVTIKYELFNINDVNKLDKYTYTYTYSGSFEAISGDEHSTTRTFKATTNGTVKATIKYEGIPIQPDEELVLDKIDNEGPRISITNNTTQTVKQSVTIPIKITDNGSGVNFNSVEPNDFNITIGTGTNNKVTDFTLTNNGNGKYDITINDNKRSGKVVITIDSNQILDNVGNGNNSTRIETNTTFDNKWTIEYNTQGGTACNPMSFDVVNGERLGTLCTTSREGYEFDGWYTEPIEGNGTKVTSATIADRSMTIYAHFHALTYTIKYDSRGGSSCNPGSFTRNYGDQYGTLCTTTKTGHSFEGWYTEPTGGSPVNSETVAKENRTIYAHWSEKKLTINFDCNGGIGGGGRLYTYGIANQKFPDPSLCTRTGFTGLKWTWDQGGTDGDFIWAGAPVTDSMIDTYSTGNTTKTVYAQWTPDPIYFDDQSFVVVYSTDEKTLNIVPARGGSGSFTYTEKSEKNSSGTSTNNISISGTTIKIKGGITADTYKVVIEAEDRNTGAKAQATYTITIAIYEVSEGSQAKRYYARIADAYSSITSSRATIKVLADFTDSSTMNMNSNKTIYLDLNNKTLKFKNKAIIQSAGELDIRYTGTINCEELSSEKSCLTLSGPSGTVLKIGKLTIKSSDGPVISQSGAKVEMYDNTTLSGKKIVAALTGGEFNQMGGTIHSDTNDYAVTVGAVDKVYNYCGDSWNGHILYGRFNVQNSGSKIDVPNGGGIATYGCGWGQISNNVNLTHNGTKALLLNVNGSGVINGSAKITSNRAPILEETGGNTTIEHTVQLTAVGSEALIYRGGISNIKADNSSNNLSIKNQTADYPLIRVTGNAALTLEGSTTSTYYSPSSQGIVVINEKGTVHISKFTFEFNGSNPFVTIDGVLSDEYYQYDEGRNNSENAIFNFGGSSTFTIKNNNGVFVVIKKGRLVFNGGEVISRNGGRVITMSGGSIKKYGTGTINIHDGYSYSDVIYIGGGSIIDGGGHSTTLQPWIVIR